MMEGTKNSFELIESNGALDYVPKRELEVWWFLVAAGALMVLVSVVLLMKRRRERKKGGTDLDGVRREAYREGVKFFDTVADGQGREMAVDVSYVLRRYLAKSLGEVALFETHEELIGRSDALSVLPEELRGEVGGFFEKLARYKYSPDSEGMETASEIKGQGREFLGRMYRA